MSPRRIIRRRLWPIYLVSFVILAGSVFASWALHDRSVQVNRILRQQQQLIYQNCVSNENQDAVIVSILRSIPPSRRSPVIVDAINTLEPPGEKDCQPPEGTQP